VSDEIPRGVPPEVKTPWSVRLSRAWGALMGNPEDVLLVRHEEGFGWRILLRPDEIEKRSSDQYVEMCEEPGVQFMSRAEWEERTLAIMYRDQVWHNLAYVDRMRRRAETDLADYKSMMRVAAPTMYAHSRPDADDAARA
jgi:hypothetical protein